VTQSLISSLAAQQCAGVSDGTRWEVSVGHEDGSVRRWTMSLTGFGAAASSAWHRSTAPSDAVVTPFVDASSGASINPEEVTIDRSKTLDADSTAVAHSGQWRKQNVTIKEMSLEFLSSSELAELVAGLEEFPKIRHHLWCQLFCHSLSANKKLIFVSAASKKSVDALLKEGKMRWRLRMKIAEQVAQFLSYLHSLSPAKLHLDLTTYSVMLDNDYNVMVDGLYGPNRIRNIHTLQGASDVLLKSQRVLPPEMLNAKKQADLLPGADMYQFGMLLWSLVRQENPFHDVVSLKDLFERVCVIVERPAIPDDCPEAIRETLVACWNADPRARPSAASLLKKVSFLKSTFFCLCL
jgi:serine/threonine protein kinase